MSDPVILNDLAGMAILDGRHEDASKLLRAAAELAETASAKIVLIERSQEQARLAFEKRLATDLSIVDHADRVTTARWLVMNNGKV